MLFRLTWAIIAAAHLAGCERQETAPAPGVAVIELSAESEVWLNGQAVANRAVHEHLLQAAETGALNGVQIRVHVNFKSADLAEIMRSIEQINRHRLEPVPVDLTVDESL